MSHPLPRIVMLNLFQHNALPLVILKQVQDDEFWLEGAAL
jgi:hypothetical protein